MFLACPARRRPRGRPRTHWSDYVAQLTWERLGILPEELEEVSGEREVWVSLLRQLPARPGTGLADENGLMDGWSFPRYQYSLEPEVVPVCHLTGFPNPNALICAPRSQEEER